MNNRNKKKLGILQSFDNEHLKIAEACDNLGVNYEIIDFISPDWLHEVRESDCDGFICHPPDNIQVHKHIFDERCYVIEKVLKRPLYPSWESIFLYENKRNVAAWLEAKGFPHIKTSVFTEPKNARAFFKNANYPLVFKTNIGASGSGVTIVKSKTKALRIAASVLGRTHKALTFGRLRFSRKKIIPLPLFGRIQKHYIIVQPFVPIKWEWRIIKIGNTYSGHQRLLKNHFASGSGNTGWDTPPEKLLNLVREVCEAGNFRSMSVDVFETLDGSYKINELQTVFGSYNTHQMKVDGVPGRFVYHDGKFNFEAGDFHQYASNKLRVLDFLNMLDAR
ncbi:MAG: ATP-grasp domain-containing protein [Bacteroidota bacterium]